MRKRSTEAPSMSCQRTLIPLRSILVETVLVSFDDPLQMALTFFRNSE